MQNGPVFLTQNDLSQIDLLSGSPLQWPTELGTVGSTGDGRRFRYVKFGGTSTINPGLLMVAAARASNSTGLALSSTNSTAQLAVGSQSLVVVNGATAVTQDQFAGNYLDILGSGAVQTYQISGNTAASASGAITVTLVDALRTAVVVGTNTVNFENDWNGAITSTSPSLPLGVTITSIPNSSTATYGGWVQTAGHCLVSATSATKGQAIVQDTSGTQGFVANSAAATTPTIGIAKESAASSVAPIFLDIAG
jgi:hypothetical protein